MAPPQLTANRPLSSSPDLTQLTAHRKTHPPGNVTTLSHWLRLPTPHSMAKAATKEEEEAHKDQRQRDTGREFDGHEVAAAARIRRREVARNEARLKTADGRDSVTIGEFTRDSRWKGMDKAREEMATEEETYLTNDSEDFFPKQVNGPDDTNATPPWFIKELRRLTKHHTATPKRSPIVFATNREAMEINESILKSFDFDMKRLIDKYARTTLGYGSEFREVEALRPLIGNHPNFEPLSRIISSGMPYVFTRELDKVTRLTELKTLLQRGNHKSAKECPKQLKELLAKDVIHGFTIPLPVRTVHNIPNAAVQPLGITRQWTLDAQGERVEKFRMTQDLSFSSGSSSTATTSINSRIDMSAYPEMIYGWCMPRIIHYVLALRVKHPGYKVLISKYDYSDAYRRIAHSAEAAEQTISVHEGIAYMSLRLTFGGSPNPPTWCLFSETVTDLANEISQCAEWKPSELHSPAQPVTPSPERLPE